MAGWEKEEERGQKDERNTHIHPMQIHTEAAGKKKSEQVSGGGQQHSVSLFLLWKCNFFHDKTLIYTDFCSVYLFVTVSATQLK